MEWRGALDCPYVGVEWNAYVRLPLVGWERASDGEWDFISFFVAYVIYLIVVPSKVDSYVSPSIGVDVKPDLFISTYVWNSSAVTEVVIKVIDT